jgi:formate-dependent nitrite reductase membrane component NrfD
VSAPDTLRKIAIVLMVIAVPGIACHGYYAYEAASGSSLLWRVAIVLAYPAIMIALVWWVSVLCAPGRVRRR